jgi:hypothetical protein
MFAWPAPEGTMRKVLGWVIVLFVAAGIFGLYKSNDPSISKSGTSQATVLPAAAVPTAQPWDSISVTKTNWVKGGFGSIALLHLTLKNSSTRAVRDVNLNCYFYGPSGSEISHTNVTVYETIPAGKSKTSKELNLGFIDTQVQTGSCHVIYAEWA